MRKKLLFLFAGVVLAASSYAQSFKGPESTTYYQLPTEGLKYEKVEAYITLDQSGDRAMMGAVSGKLGGALGANNPLSKAADAVGSSMKDITEVWDTWPLKPRYIRAENGSGGVLRLEVKYKPDDTARPMGVPPANSTTGIYQLSYKVEASMKVTTEDGTVILEKNFGVLTGNIKTNTPYVHQSAAENGIGTYEYACIRVAMNKSRQELFGRYGFGVMNAKLQLGVVKEIPESKKLIPGVLEVLEAKNTLMLAPEGMAKVKELADVLEAGLSATTAKTTWVAYHNLAVCYAFLQDADKANEYLDKYYAESKESFDKVTTFGQKGGSKSYGLKDLKQYEGYCNIESFVKFYPKGAKMYPALLTALNRPLKKFTDFYTHNDLLCQVYSIDFPFQFFPLNDFQGAPKNGSSSLAIDGVQFPIVIDYDFDSKRRIKEATTKQKYLKEDGSEDDRDSRKMQPIYNKETDQFVMISNPNSRIGGDEKSELRHFKPVLDEQTFGEADNIMRNVGLTGDKGAKETLNLEFDLDGNMYFMGKSDYFAPVPVFNEMLVSNGITVKRTDVTTVAEAKTQINEAGVLTDWIWKGNPEMSFSSLLGGDQGSIKADMVKHIKVVESDEKGYPKKIEYTFSAKGSFKTATAISFKQWLDATKQWKEAKPDVNGDQFTIPATTIIWDCAYEYDAEGNWIKMQVGPYTATRSFKY